MTFDLSEELAKGAAQAPHLDWHERMGRVAIQGTVGRYHRIWLGDTADEILAMIERHTQD